MAVKIRLKRMGKKKQPTYRVVVADSRSPRDGRIIERLGRYDPRQEPSLVEIDNERAQYWLSTGAQPTDRVRKLLEISGAVARAKVSRSGVYRLDDDPPPAAEKPVGQEAVESQEETKAESQETQENQEEPAAEQSETQPEAGGEVPAETADSPEPLKPSDPSPVDEAKEAEETEETEVAEEALDAGEPVPGPVGEDTPEASAEPTEQTQDAQESQEVKDTQEKEEKAT